MPPKGAVANWMAALIAVEGRIQEDPDEYPLGEVELACDQMRAPNDTNRIEYKRGKLSRQE